MHLKRKSIFVFLVALFISSFLIQTVLWFFHSGELLYGDLPLQTALRSYVNNHHQELKDKLFNQIFVDAEKCYSLRNEVSRTNCQADITNQLAVLIKEEELLDSYRSGWPSDLFFVKQINDKFYRLGWEGKVENISSFVNADSINYELKFVESILQGKCKTFETTLKNLPSCQIYFSIDLGQDQRGYVIRRIPITDENDFQFIFIAPFVVIFSPILIPSSIYGLLTGQKDYYILISSLGPYIFGIAAVKIYHLLKNRNKS